MSARALLVLAAFLVGGLVGSLEPMWPERLASWWPMAWPALMTAAGETARRLTALVAPSPRIVAGALGAIAGLVGLVILAMWWRRRRPRADATLAMAVTPVAARAARPPRERALQLAEAGASVAAIAAETGLAQDGVRTLLAVR